MKGTRIPYSRTELDWISAMRDTPRAEAHALFCQIFGRTDVNIENFKALCTRKGWTTGRTGQFEKGVKRPDNPARKGYCAPGCEKGWFRKGERNGVATALYQPIGTERVTRDGYRERKINDDLPLKRRWRAVHLIEWEKANGPVPAGHALKCIDGDRTNTDPSNWICIPRALLPRLNARSGRDYDTAPADVKPVILQIARLEHAARQARKGRDA